MSVMISDDKKELIVTRVEVLDKCPVDFRVKKVASKEIRRGEYTVIP